MDRPQWIGQHSGTPGVYPPSILIQYFLERSLGAPWGDGTSAHVPESNFGVRHIRGVSRGKLAGTPRVELIVAAGPEAGKKFPVSERRTVIGRRKGDILIRDVEISGTHCVVEVDDTGSVSITDLDSTNGTYVNGKRVQRAELSNNDRLTLGQSKVTVRIEQPQAAAQPMAQPAAQPAAQPVPQPARAAAGASAGVGAGGGMDMGAGLGGAFDAEGIGALITEELEGFSENTDSLVLDLARAEEELKLPFRTNLYLEFLEGEQAGTRFQFPKGNIVIGRLNADLVVKDSDVSRRHALVEAYTRDKIFVKDLASTNGTYVNGQKVTYDKLKHGDKIRVGRTVLRFIVEELQ